MLKPGKAAAIPMGVQIRASPPPFLFLLTVSKQVPISTVLVAPSLPLSLFVQLY